MAYQPNPNDPYRDRIMDDGSRQQRLSSIDDDQLQISPVPAESPASTGKIAMFAVAIAVVLGAAFYGLNNTSVNPSGTTTTAQNSQATSPPAAPPGMRDVTPRANTEPGMTTGAAPSRPATTSPSAPADAPMNRTVTPPTDNATAPK